MWFEFDHQFNMTLDSTAQAECDLQTVYCIFYSQGVSMLGLFCASRQGQSCKENASNPGV